MLPLVRLASWILWEALRLPASRAHVCISPRFFVQSQIHIFSWHPQCCSIPHVQTSAPQICSTIFLASQIILTLRSSCKSSTKEVCFCLYHTCQMGPYFWVVSKINLLTSSPVENFLWKFQMVLARPTATVNSKWPCHLSPLALLSLPLLPLASTSRTSDSLQRNLSSGVSFLPYIERFSSFLTRTFNCIYLLLAMCSAWANIQNHPPQRVVSSHFALRKVFATLLCNT